MRTLSDTITRMAQFRGGPGAAGAAGGRLQELNDFGANPGELRAKIYAPDGIGPNAPLVVVLHGCTQSAEDYDRGTGWSTLAEREGFVLLYPEQVRGNNSNLCFNWFVPGDTTRGRGEVQSIAQMVEAVLANHSVDPAKVFVTGLSAGGAMTSAMLATYPELFAGGAIIAGLPYGSATNVPEAFDRMRNHGGPSDAQLAAAVRNAAKRAGGAWPTVSIWHGTTDATVSFSNMARIGKQWRGVHGVDENHCDIEHGLNWKRWAWAGTDGRTVVEEWSITGMGHGVPIDGAASVGVAAPYILDVGVSSTERIARSWGISGADLSVAASTPAPRAAAPKAAKRLKPVAAPVPEAKVAPVQQIIENALRAAGLMQ